MHVPFLNLKAQYAGCSFTFEVAVIYEKWHKPDAQTKIAAILPIFTGKSGNTDSVYTAFKHHLSAY